MHTIREGHVFAAAAVLSLPLAIVVPKSMAPLLAVAAVAILAVRHLRGRPIPLGAIRLAAAAAAFIAYALLTAVWSRTPAHTAYAILPLAGITIGGLVVLASILRLDDDDRRIVAKGLFVAGVVGFSFLLFERLTDIATLRWVWGMLGRPPIPIEHAPLHLNRAMTVAALMAWPWAAVALRWHSLRAGFATLAIGCAVVLTADATAPVAAIAMGVLVAIAAWIVPRLVPYAFGAALAVGVLMGPLIPGLFPHPLKESAKVAFMSNSAIHRLFIWRATADLIRERPILGYGFDTSRSFYGHNDTVPIQMRPDDPKRTYELNFEPIPLHPHNMVLQVWLELGAVGALFMLAVLLSIVVAIARSGLERVEKSLCFGFFASALVIAVVSFGAWQAWWLSALWLCGALTAGAVLTPLRSRSA
ncbi:MAG: O-antigen ligase family protein [Hyphomicrobium sp.]|nr:O-antigen ligase family protein [Hyphomicrobium sp.]